MHLRHSASILMAAVAICAGAADKKPVDIDTLIGQMTLDEKVGQLNQLSGWGDSPEMISLIQEGSVGSLLNEVDPAVVNKLQRAAVEDSRLGIPLIFARDVIHGFKTIFPIPLGIAATWNPELAEQGAAIAADEASSVGVRWTFSPMVDISRDGRWGRIAESYGEDPLLNSTFGAATVKGYQGDNLSNPHTMAACVKHFAGYGASEAGKDYNNVWLPTPLLHDVYLPAYKACVDAGAATVMCSFNDLNGIPASGNEWLLKDLLRGEWGFDGVVVSDWNSIGQMMAQGYAADLADAARIGANAGVDIDMEAHSYPAYLKQQVLDGTVSEATIDSLVRNVLVLKQRLGLFENPYVDMANANRFYLPASLDAARRTAAESAVLLKNNGVLPLAAVSKVAIVGPMADAKHDQNGTWCFDLEKEQSVTPLQAFTQALGKDNIFYAPGLKSTRDRSHDGFAQAIDAAENADVVLCFVGEEAVLSGEAHCRADISLPGAQTELLQALKQTGKPVVMVVMTGRPMTIADEVELADATLYTFHGGTMAGPAIADLVLGATSPSGHLPVTMPKMTGQLPLYYNHMKIGRPAEQVAYIDDLEMEAGQTSTGCTSFYLDAGDGPAFPFGFGLTYTTFEYGEPVLSAEQIGADGTVNVSCDITNTGDRVACAVPQLYICDKVSSLIQPVRRLVDFDKVEIEPGQTVTVSFSLPAQKLGFTNNHGQYVVEPGDFDVWVASDAMSGSPVNLNVK